MAHSIDPEFREQATRICDLYLHPPPDSVVVCVDEMPGVQALKRKYPDHWGGRTGKRELRREFEYVRGGTQALIAGFEVRSGEVISRCGDDRSAASLELFMEDLAAKYPTGTVYIVWDNATRMKLQGLDSRSAKVDRGSQATWTSME